jgi:hypothetical protein
MLTHFRSSTSARLSYIVSLALNDLQSPISVRETTKARPLNFDTKNSASTPHKQASCFTCSTSQKGSFQVVRSSLACGTRHARKQALNACHASIQGLTDVRVACSFILVRTDGSLPFISSPKPPVLCGPLLDQGRQIEDIANRNHLSKDWLHTACEE